MVNYRLFKFTKIIFYPLHVIWGNSCKPVLDAYDKKEELKYLTIANLSAPLTEYNA